MALTYGDVLRPPTEAAGAPQRRARLLGAAAAMREAIAAAEAIIEGVAARAMCDAAVQPEVGAQRNLWEYSAEALEGVAQWLEARTLAGAERTALGAQAIERVDRAVRHVHAIGPMLKGTWGAYDLDRSHGIWLEGLRRRLEE
jgi:hypothetical protein